MLALKCKVLSKMTIYIFAIPIIIVSFESAFSVSSRVLSDYRSSISPRILDALVCSGNLIQASNKSLKDPMVRFSFCKFIFSIT